MSAKNHDACPDFDTLSMAFSDPSSAPDVEAHAERCSACAAVLTDLARMREAAKLLAWSGPSPSEAETLEAKLLEQAIFERQRDRRVARQRRVIIAVGALAASIAAAFLGARSMVRAPSEPTRTAPVVAEVPLVEKAPVATAEPRAIVRGSSGATFERRVVASSARTDEVVELASGTMTFDVPALAADRGFLLVTGDVEIDARDASLTAVARDGKLVSIAVLSGKVEVRPKDAAAVTITAGQRWSPAAIASSSGPGGSQASLQTESSRPARTTAAERPQPERPSRVVTPREVVRGRDAEVQGDEPARAHEPSKGAEGAEVDGSEPRADASKSADAAKADVATDALTPEIPARPRTVGSAATPAERAFAEGWERLRSGDVRGATARFDEAELLANGSSIAEDASYWRAVALARAKRADDAIRAMTTYLERHGRSARAGELRVALGWLLYERGALDAAEGRFAEALDDASPRVRESAERGKKVIEAARAR
ncbi:FecR domain-containing protein [Myxococcota bacterium]|nr:FecR domain-containing protein [Myxococcota bacterium]